MKTNRFNRQTSQIIVIGMLCLSIFSMYQIRQQVVRMIDVYDTLAIGVLGSAGEEPNVAALEELSLEPISYALLGSHSGSFELVTSTFPSQRSIQPIIEEYVRKRSTGALTRSGLFNWWRIYPLTYAQQDYLFILHYPRDFALDSVPGAFIGLMVVLLVLILLLTIIRRIIREEIYQPIRQIEVDLQEMAVEDTQTLSYTRVSSPHVNSLQQTVETLKGRLMENQRNLYQSEQRLSLVLDSINLGVILLNGQKHIELINPEAQSLLQLSDAVIGRNYEGVIRSNSLVTMIAESMQTGEAMSEEIELYIPTLKAIDVNIIPYSEPKQADEESILVLLYDISKVKHLEVVRTEFVANASHELRTPVTAIKGFAETLMDGAIEDTQMAKQFIQIIYNESNRLETLIHDILELSRIENETHIDVIETFDLVKVTQEMVAFFQERAEQKDIRIQTELPEAPILLSVDQHRVEQILRNLIENAIKYSGNESEVDVTVYSNHHRATIIVSDTGIGIPEQDQERIFERFYRVDKGRSRHSGGTGLGLSIVRNLVNVLGGSITVESELGVGSTFIVTLPL
ncbi:PAS domain-containing sensor histidine kinase [Suicoccus acidiformans]|uniref:histidine kinase n=1 Tax=Suicoccus acidiformans TaxID=2036206 RepID=A0A347WNB4_9LACT|nr:ATP-binding protein [Suicoccus acidiformans]AXY26571.1 PAS domain-containing sensor histidine kinase [Suicoccus acidiformans]